MYVHTRAVLSFHHKLKLTVEKAIYHLYNSVFTCKAHVSYMLMEAKTWLCCTCAGLTGSGGRGLVGGAGRVTSSCS